MKFSALNIVFWLFLFPLSAKEISGTFSNYTINDGLSQSTVDQIFQDKKGFLWMGTTDGLNRFDGNKFITYKNKYNNPFTLSDNWIVRILKEDSQNNLWILTTDRVINRLNLRTGKCLRYIPGNSDSTGLLPFKVLYSIEEDNANNIWISTNSGIYKLPLKDNSIEQISKTNIDIDLNKVDNGDKSEKLDMLTGPRIYRDTKGKLWFFSSLGVFCYNYKTGKLSPNLIPSITNKENIPLRIVEDKQEQLWIFTGAGFLKYLPEKNQFQFIPLNRLNTKNNISWVSSLKNDSKGFMWIGTDIGLVRFNPISEIYDFYNTQTPISISNDRISYIKESSDSSIWIGTYNGLNRFTYKTLNFEKYWSKPGEWSDNSVNEIVEVRGGEIWVLGNLDRNLGGVINKVNFVTHQMESVLNNPGDPKSIASSLVFSPFVDNSGNLWLGTFGNGVIKYTPRISKFDYFSGSFGQPLNPASVWGFCEDSAHNIWIAKNMEGITRWSPSTNTFTNFVPDIRVNGKKVNVAIMSIYVDKKGQLWLATMGAGIVIFNPVNGKTTIFTDKENKIESRFVRLFTTNNNNEIISMHPNSGFEIINTETGKVQVFRNDKLNPNSLTGFNIWFVLQDKKGNYWISAEGYLSYYITAQNKYEVYKCKSPNSILAEKALSIHEDKLGNIWFGTAGGGLSRFDYTSKKFRHYTEDEGLANNTVYGILEDDDGNLWLTTNNGVSKFNPSKETFQNYYQSSGLQSNEFNAGAFFKDSKNHLYIGGIAGFNVFDPRQVINDTVTPLTVLTGLQIFNKNITVYPSFIKDNYSKPGKLIIDSSGYYLPENIGYLSQLIIPPSVKVFSIEFAALLYNSPEKFTYRYKMEKFDDDWNYSDTRNVATYTNLPAGTYTFKVMAANADGVWNKKVTELQIVVIPPYWKTKSFIIGLIILALILVWLYIYLRLRHLRNSKELLEQTVAHRTRLIEEKNEELKLRNIEISRQKEEIDFQAKQLKSELALQNQASELALLRSQVNPHFLFNTLNNIYALVNQKSDDAAHAVMKLSETMRYMLYEATADQVPLDKEINYIKSYIELQSLRLRNRNCVEFSITGSMEGKFIAPMLLIPFIENAFKHGDKRNENPCLIINLALNGKQMVFTTENWVSNHQTNAKDKTGGIGLTNVQRRLQLLHPLSHKLEIVNSDGKFSVLLELTLNDH